MTDIENPEALLKAHEKAKQDLIELRAELNALEKERDEFKTQLDKASSYREKAIKAEVKAQLEGTGVKNADRILKYLNLDGLEYDEEDKLTGVDEKLAVVKEDFPELFDVKRRAARQDVDAHASNPVKPKLSGTEAQVAQMFGRDR